MEENQRTAPEQTPTNRMSAWEIALAAVILVACLLGGLAMAEAQAPAPAIGVLRFGAAIDFDTASQFVDMTEAARQDPNIAAVVLEISSPGGFATSSESIFYSLLSLRKSKPVVVVVDGMAASGGYYMAVAGNRIYAPPSSYIGNVGTRGGRPTDPALAPNELTSGPYKLEGGSRFEQIHQLDLVRNAFLNNVVTQRTHAEVNPLKLTAAEVAEARIYLGSEAVALGLIDGEGGRPEAIEAAAELAGLTDYQVVDLPAFLGMPPIAASQDPTQQAQSLLAHAAPGTIFLVDSRIPLPEDVLPPDLQRLRKPRSGNDYVLPGWNSQPSPSQTTFADRLAPASTQP